MSKAHYSEEELEFRFHKLIFYIRKQIPGFRLRSKVESKLMQLLSVVLFFNKRFMEDYVTTLYPMVYVPELPWDEQPVESRIITLAHEYVHLKDRKRLGWLFNILYLSPQIFALLAIGAFWNLWFLLALLFLLPLPSPGRAWLEWRGYRMSMALYWALTGQRVNIFWVREQFTSSQYYWMWPFKRSLEAHILKAAEDIESGKFLSPEIFEILEIIKKED